MEKYLQRRRLAVRGRPTLEGKFRHVELLYRCVAKNDFDELGMLDIECFESSDLSVNWSRFSLPADVLCRQNANPKDGCVSFTVEQAKYENLAIPCHDPIEGNYSHTEIRWLKDGETVEPVHGRKNSKSQQDKVARQKWRVYICTRARMELNPT